ncbi:MAG TPA: hypothetical protein VMM18_05400 [Gemmatimonadaceae bacterium]|nr:hypothetical protein [Gemmatimonadaceae bacterium]
MRRASSLTFAALALGLVVAGCGRDVVAPQQALAPVGAPRPDIIIDRIADDSLSADFTVTPTGGAFVLGKHAIFFPADVICDPRTSTYGVSEWDAPCDLLTEPIQIHAEIRHQDGFQWIEFTPELRFVPTNDPFKYVWLYLKSEQAREPDMLERFAILWSPDGVVGIDESVGDPTMATYLWRDQGIIFRRIKHFSHYQGSDGFKGDVVYTDALVVEVSF